MDLEDTAVIFVVEYYELLQANRERLSTAYADGARILLYHRDKPLRTINANSIPKGHRTILQCTGETIPPFLYIHVISNLTTSTGVEVLDEAFTCTVHNQSIQILYQSIHVGPILAEIPPLPPPPAATKPVQPPPPKPKPKAVPVEVSDPNELNEANAVLVLNLPFRVPPSDYVTVLEKFGEIPKFAQTSGKLLVEFRDRRTRNEALHAVIEDWHDRLPKYRPMSRPFSWDPPRRS
jgi:hypothetical protein